MKRFITFLFAIISLLPVVSWGQLYWGGTSAESWTAVAGTRWGTVNGGPYATNWVSGSAAVFNVANSTITGATTAFSSITANENVTMTSFGTIGTGGAIASITVANGKTFDFGNQAISTAAGTGFNKLGAGELAMSGNTYPGGLTLNEGTFIVKGVNAVGTGILTINGGILAASVTKDLSNKPSSIVIGGNFTLGATTGLALSNADLTFNASVSLGNSTARIITIGGTGTYTFSGIISGTSSNITVASTAAGTLALTGANTYSGTTTVSGGTLQLNRIGGAIPSTNNVTISGGTLQISSNQTVNNLTLSSGNLTVDNGVTLTINGTFNYSGGTITSTGATIAYGASSTLVYAGSVAQTTTSAELPSSSGPYNLTINNSSGVTLGGDVTVNGTLTLTSGNLAVGSNTLTIGSSGTAQCNTNVISGAGTFTLSSGATLAIGSTAGISSSGATGNIQTTTRNFNAGGIYYYNGDAQQNSGNGLPSTITGYLSVNQSYGLVLDVPVTVAGLHLNNGKIYLGSNDVIITDEVTSSDNSTMYVVTNGTGTLKWLVYAASTRDFPVGDATNYSPVSLNFTSGTFSSAYAGVKVSNSKHANNISSTNYLNRYWTVTSGGISSFSCDATFTYVDTDIQGTEASLYCGKWSGSSWSLLNAANTGSNQLSGTVTSFSDFTGGEQAALPVELTTFTASNTDNGVQLNWETTTEVNNYGFEIFRFAQNDMWEKVGFVNGHGNSNSPKSYTFTDAAAPAGKVEYRLKQIDFDGKFEYSIVAEVNVEVPGKLVLYQNMPNPFNPTTEIKFALPKVSNVELSIYNMLGEKVETLASGMMNAGEHKVSFNATNLSSGVYFYKLTTESNSSIKKMILMK
ncbi:MAG: T9SS type A sorting domain-containing protein [Melioribacteraceae bacterium]